MKEGEEKVVLLINQIVNNVHKLLVEYGCKLKIFFFELLYKQMANYCIHLQPEGNV